MYLITSNTHLLPYNPLPPHCVWVIALNALVRPVHIDTLTIALDGSGTHKMAVISLQVASRQIWGITIKFLYSWFLSRTPWPAREYIVYTVIIAWY